MVAAQTFRGGSSFGDYRWGFLSSFLFTKGSIVSGSPYLSKKTGLAACWSMMLPMWSRAPLAFISQGWWMWCWRVGITNCSRSFRNQQPFQLVLGGLPKPQPCFENWSPFSWRHHVSNTPSSYWRRVVVCPNRTLQLVRPGFFMFDEKSAKEAKLSWENLELLSRILGELGEKWGWPYFPSVTSSRR